MSTPLYREKGPTAREDGRNCNFRTLQAADKQKTFQSTPAAQRRSEGPSGERGRRGVGPMVLGKVRKPLEIRDFPDSRVGNGGDFIDIVPDWV